jgi:hypothetical protein
LHIEPTSRIGSRRPARERRSGRREALNAGIEFVRDIEMPLRVEGDASRMMAARPRRFQIGDRAPSTTPILDPRAPPIPNQPAGWADFLSYLFIPQAGCYVLEAAWPGGMWRLTFAAGRSAALGGA